jgi:cyclopropane fatty-acyl-phospholipid synthase-like methyltransferase
MDDILGSPYDFYERYYRVTAASPAYADFCLRAYGANHAQHGFADMEQVDLLLDALALRPGDRVLELGCGSGGSAAYMAERTGAHVTGIDFAPAAIALARQRARGSEARLAFEVADMAALPFAPAAFDAIVSIDTLYFTDLRWTIGTLKRLLAPGGQMGILYTHGADPVVPIAVFPRETLPPDRTPLADALRSHGLVYTACDLTRDDLRHAQRARQALEALRPAFAAEGTLWLYDNRMAEALGIAAAIEAGAHARYLYHVRLT